MSIFDFKDANPVPIVPAATNVPHDLQKMSKILVLLLEFEGKDGVGPKHNEIPKPANQNFRVWVPDFSPKHYHDMLFSREPNKISMANYYLESSSGRYTVEGDVFGWFKLPFSEAHYGKDRPGDVAGHDSANGPFWRIVRDAGEVIKKDAEGKKIDWASYDTVDRYDWDQDGNYNEPDGYVDHVMLVHAGMGQEAGGGKERTDAIWSHRGRARFLPPGSPNKVGPKKYTQLGGFQMDAKADIWIMDYTVMPEDGATGVFAHEFGHDLNLPDLYDTQPQHNSESSVAFWSIMSAGSWTGLRGEPLGTTPTHFSPWGKMKLGWLDYDEITVGNEDIHKFVLLDRSEYQGRKAQALKINLPDYHKRVEIIAPVAGRQYAYSDTGHDLNQRLSTTIDLTNVKNAQLKFKAFYEIENDYDYAYVEIENDEGQMVSITGNITTAENPNGSNLGHGITGNSKEWVNAEFDLTPFVGRTRKLRFRYVTDPAAGGKGFAIDDVRVKAIKFRENFETGSEFDSKWESKGFVKVKNGALNRSYKHYYLAEWRTLYGYDRALDSVYFFHPAMRRVGYYSYQPGVLLWYRNEFYADGGNQVGLHPGEGALLVVDARSKAEGLTSANPYSTGMQIHDATFGFQRSNRFRVYDVLPLPGNLGGTQAVSVFNDRNSYYDETTPYSSVKIPTYGLMFSLLNTSADQSAVQLAIHYTPPFQ